MEEMCRLSVSRKPVEGSKNDTEYLTCQGEKCAAHSTQKCEANKLTKNKEYGQFQILEPNLNLETFVRGLTRKPYTDSWKSNTH
jgi:uncharacterized protein (UPF0179 family)